MPQQKPVNPFYVALVPAGIVFAVTACAYGVMTVRGLDPHHAANDGLIRLMEQRGLVILVVELSLLAVLTVAAIGTDDFWMRRFEQARQTPSEHDDQP